MRACVSLCSSCSLWPLSTKRHPRPAANGAAAAFSKMTTEPFFPIVLGCRRRIRRRGRTGTFRKQKQGAPFWTVGPVPGSPLRSASSGPALFFALAPLFPRPFRPCAFFADATDIFFSLCCRHPMRAHQETHAPLFFRRGLYGFFTASTVWAATKTKSATASKDMGGGGKWDKKGVGTVVGSAYKIRQRKKKSTEGKKR